MNANLTSMNIRPASGRAFVRVAFRGGRGLTATRLHPQLNTLSAMPANLSLAPRYEDPSHPGGGGA